MPVPAEPLPALPLAARLFRLVVLAWNLLVIYAQYKWVQKRPGLSDEERQRRYSREHRRNAGRIYRLALRLEGVLIKACQFISSRADVAPPEYVSVLSRLQDRVPPRRYSEIAAQVERELGAPPSRIFRAFSHEPVASASLAQVHRATTHEGHDVAVKVQYPGIARIVDADLRNLRLLVALLARIERNFDFRVLMDEYARYTPRELDFVLEAESTERVAHDLAHRADVRVPAVYHELSARRVLTTEYIDGIKISNIPALLAAGIDPNQVAQVMVEAYCEQILVHGYFHADPHPGNLIVLPGPVVAFIDFGLSKDLTPEFRQAYARLTIAIMQQDDSAMVDAFRAIGFRTRSEDPESLVALGRAFFESTGPDQKAYLDAEVMPEINERLSRILTANPVTQIPGEMLLIFRVLGLMSGLQKRLDSQVNMFEAIIPYAEAEAAG